MIHLKLTKIGSKPDRPHKPLLKDGYVVRGFAMWEPIVGAPFRVFRYERNGVNINGVLTTTHVTRITRKTKNSVTFETANSWYRYLKLTPLSEVERHAKVGI